MSKKNRRYAFKRGINNLVGSGECSISVDDMLNIVSPNLEVLTDNLIDELVGSGWVRSVLIEARDNDLIYCRNRNSFFCNNF